MLQWSDSNKKWIFIDTLQMQFSQPFLNKIALFLCSYESWESEDFKTILTLTYRRFQTKVMSLSILTWVFFNESFWDILQSKFILSYFLAYFGQFKSKSHIQGHPQKVENQSFHLTPSLMRFLALLLEILL